MKKFLISAIASVALAAGALGYYANSNQTELNALTLQNIEALTNGEDGYTSLSCDSSLSGTCNYSCPYCHSGQYGTGAFLSVSHSCK